mgnify:CR=1 FL=1
MDADTGTAAQMASGPLWTPRWTARGAVVEELRKHGTVRNADVAAALGLKSSTVGSIMHWLRLTGCARRLKMGVYQFVRLPEHIKAWEREVEGNLSALPVGETMPEKIINLLRDAPDQTMSFLALWRRSRLTRQATGAVLSKLARRGVVERVRRGRYRLVYVPRAVKGWPDLLAKCLAERPWMRISETHRAIDKVMSEDTLRKTLRKMIAAGSVVRVGAFYAPSGETADMATCRAAYAADRPKRRRRRKRLPPAGT